MPFEIFAVVVIGILPWFQIKALIEAKQEVTSKNIPLCLKTNEQVLKSSQFSQSQWHTGERPASAVYVAAQDDAM